MSLSTHDDKTTQSVAHSNVTIAQDNAHHLNHMEDGALTVEDSAEDFYSIVHKFKEKMAHDATHHDEKAHPAEPVPITRFQHWRKYKSEFDSLIKEIADLEGHINMLYSPKQGDAAKNIALNLSIRTKKIKELEALLNDAKVYVSLKDNEEKRMPREAFLTEVSNKIAVFHKTLKKDNVTLIKYKHDQHSRPIPIVADRNQQQTDEIHTGSSTGSPTTSPNYLIKRQQKNLMIFTHRSSGSTSQSAHPNISINRSNSDAAQPTAGRLQQIEQKAKGVIKSLLPKHANAQDFKDTDQLAQRLAAQESVFNKNNVAEKPAKCRFFSCCCGGDDNDNADVKYQKLGSP